MNFAEEVEQRINNMAKPPGSLGIWEKQIRKVFLAWGHFEKKLNPVHLIFAADNGVVRSGIVQQLPEITYRQSKHMVEGSAAVRCFCRCNDIPWQVVDVGIDHEEAVGINYKVARGTKDFSVEPAMTKEELNKALRAGQNMVYWAKKKGYNFLSFGEMGIGNTTTSAAVLTAIAPPNAAFLVGYGSAQGNYSQVLQKREIVSKGIKRYAPQIHTAADAIRYVGGFDLAALCGAMLACREHQLPFYIDGFITAVALACAVQLNPEVRNYSLPSHMSRESGMGMALRMAGIDEYEVPIHAEMALGEGTGAVLASVILRSVLYAVTNMATLSSINREAEAVAQEKSRSIINKEK